MAFKLVKKDSGTWQDPAPGVTTGVLYGLCDIGSSENRWGKLSREIIALWELPEQLNKDGKPLITESR